MSEAADQSFSPVRGKATQRILEAVDGTVEFSETAGSGSGFAHGLGDVADTFGSLAGGFGGVLGGGGGLFTGLLRGLGGFLGDVLGGLADVLDGLVDLLGAGGIASDSNSYADIDVVAHGHTTGLGLLRSWTLRPAARAWPLTIR